MKWFENIYLRYLPSQFLLWKQWTREVKVSRIMLAVSIRLILPYMVLPYLVLPHMILSFRASLQSHHGPCVWPLSEKNWLTASSKKIDIKNYKMHPWQRWLGGFVDCHAGWLTSLRIGNRFDYFQNLSFFMTTFCNVLIENQPGCEGLLLNDIEMFANLREFQYEKR